MDQDIREELLRFELESIDIEEELEAEQNHRITTDEAERIGIIAY